MKKNFDYDQTEKWLSGQFSGVEKHIKYKGGALGRIDNKSGRGSFFQYPAVRIIGAFLVLVLIGGSLFGALKFLEYKGAQISASHGAVGTGQVSDVRESSTDNEHGFGYEDTFSYEYALTDLSPVSYDSDPDGFAVVLTGSEMYRAHIKMAYVTEKTSFETIEMSLCDTDFDYSSDFIFGGDLVIYDNVQDRTMTILKVTITGDDEKFAFNSVDEAAEYFRTITNERKYKVMVDVTWDNTHLVEEGDKYTAYSVTFSLTVTGDGKYIRRNYVSGETDRKNHYLVVRSNKGTYFPAVDLIRYTKQLPSGEINEKNYDYTESLVLTVPYGNDFGVENNVADKEMNVISIEAHDTSDHLYTAHEFTGIADLYEYLKNTCDGLYSIHILVTWDIGDEIYTYSVTFNVYKDNDAEAYSPNGRLIVQAGNNVFYPGIIRKMVFFGDKISETLYDDTVIYEVKYKGYESLGAWANSEGQPMIVCSITVDMKYNFNTFNEAFEFVRSITEGSDHTAYVEAIMAWDPEFAGGEANVKTNRTEYTYAFTVSRDNSAESDEPHLGSIRLNIGDSEYYPELRLITDQSTGIHDDLGALSPLFEWNPTDNISITNSREADISIIGISVFNNQLNDTFTDFEAAMKRVAEIYGHASIFVEVSWDDIEGITYTYLFDILITGSPSGNLT